MPALSFHSLSQPPDLISGFIQIDLKFVDIFLAFINSLECFSKLLFLTDKLICQLLFFGLFLIGPILDVGGQRMNHRLVDISGGPILLQSRQGWIEIQIRKSSLQGLNQTDGDF